MRPWRWNIPSWWRNTPWRRTAAAPANTAAAWASAEDHPDSCPTAMDTIPGRRLHGAEPHEALGPHGRPRRRHLLPGRPPRRREDQRTENKVRNVPLQAGDTVTLVSAGGGGYGDPKPNSDPEKRSAGITREGKISPETMKDLLSGRQI